MVVTLDPVASIGVAAAGVVGAALIVAGLAIFGDFGGIGTAWDKVVRFLSPREPRHPRLARIYSAVVFVVLGAAWLGWSMTR